MNEQDKQSQTPMVLFNILPEESLEQDNSIDKSSGDSCWKHFAHLPIYSHVKQSLQSSHLKPSNQIEKQRKSDRLYSKMTDQIPVSYPSESLIYSNSNTNLKSSKQTDKPLFVQFNDHVSERKPPSIKEERRKARSKYQLLLWNTIRNNPTSLLSTVPTSVRRVLTFDD